jgi:2-polyprenyl-3-methyl-5-hydroxy-6-metoxy-1,4-benzoquinol methylase
MDKGHWEKVYEASDPTQVSWYQAEPRVSLHLIERVATGLDSAIIDVGGGASTLVDALLDAGHHNITVLDIVPSALAVAKQRLGERAERVHWMAADILDAEFPEAAYDVWHDRAVFHFLTKPEDRERYVAQVLHSVTPDGHVVVASFAPEGPTHCSGLDVVRYSPESMHREFGPSFSLIDSTREEHHTPSGRTQEFLYCLCRRAS